MKLIALFLLIINSFAVWVELGKALDPKLDPERRKQAALLAAICFSCAVLDGWLMSE